MPNDVYNSSYSGTELDSAIGKIINNGQSSVLIVYTDGQGGIKFAPLPNIEASSLKATGIANGKVLMSNEGGASWVDLLIDENDIDSGVASSGKVLTADGTGGASWVTPSGGGGSYTSTFPIDIVGNNISLRPNSQSSSLVLKSSNGTSGWSLITNDMIASIGATAGKALIANSLGLASWGTPTIYGTDILATGVTNGKVLCANDGVGSWVDIVVDKDQIDSGSSTTGYVLTSNGDGTASWAAASPGSFTSTFPIDIVGNNISIRPNSQNSSLVLKSSNGSIGWSLITSDMIASAGATNGQVLTADGTGGVSWTTPSGGGSYTATNGITISQNGEIGISSTISDSGKILRVNPSGSVYWDDLIETEYIDTGAYTDDYVLCAGTTAHWRRVDPNIFS